MLVFVVFSYLLLNKELKICRFCKNQYPLVNFNKNKRQKDGYATICRICDKAYNKAHYRKHSPKEKVPVGHKKCSKCKGVKLFNEFNRRGATKLQSECKACRLLMYQEWRKSGGKEWENNYSKERKVTDPEYKLRSILRLRLLDALKRQLRGGKVSNHHSALFLIGCSIEELKEYLEEQFIEEMSWRNHGKLWEIDHIIPCTWFNLEQIEEQQKCFHYTNLQPLFKSTKEVEGITYLGNRNKRNLSDYKQ